MMMYGRVTAFTDGKRELGDLPVYGKILEGGEFYDRWRQPVPPHAGWSGAVCGSGEQENTDGTGIEYRYDADDRICLSIYPDGGKERRWYDAAGNLTGVCRPEQYHEKEDTGESFSYEYDAGNRLVQITGPDGKVRKRYVYDLHGNICKVIGAKGMETGETDEERLCKKTDRNGTETHCTYNMYGNLLTRTAGGLSERYKYTPDGLLKSAISGGMRYSYTYDTMGRLREKRASGRKLLSFVYDRNGNLTGQEDVTGKVTEYRYNLLDQVEEVWDGGKRIAAYTYNLDGTVRSIKNGNSLYTEYAYDADKNLTMLKTVLGAETIIENHYHYDGNGNRTEKQQKHGATAYTYDRLNQLV